MKSDTIAAIATAMSPSGIGIIRISGDEAVTIADRIYQSKNKTVRLADCESHTIHYGYICDGDEIIDEVMVLLMRGPRSFTAEDTVEIDCHGGVYVMKRVLETVIKYGARPAEPGEFTKRAFLNGRIDLTQAESVIDMIQSKNEYARISSLNQLRGSVLSKVKEIRAHLLREIAFIESALDDPEHISLVDYPSQLHGIVENELNSVDKLLISFDNGRLYREGIQTAIVGKPNVGKSSLLNILAGCERAIVTDIAGTTRDIIEEQINLNGISLNIMDTAGIHRTEDVVERIGVDKAKNLALSADLVIYVMDASKEMDEDDFEIMKLLDSRKSIILMNKSDLNTVVTKERDLCDYQEYQIIQTSTKEGTGLQELEEAIKQLFFQGEISFNDEIFAVNARQKDALLEAKSHLGLVLQSIEDDMPEDFYSIDLMSAYEMLGQVIGESVEDDLVEEIFSKFCMGK